MSNLRQKQQRYTRWLPPVPFVVLDHFTRHWKLRLFLHPKTHTEHVQAKKLYDKNPLYKTTADKYLVREFVEEHVGEKYLVPLLTVTDNPKSIDFDALPDSFVAKGTHGSGTNLIVRDKLTLNVEEARNAMSAWLKLDYYKRYKEWAYKDLEPKIVVEEFMRTADGEPPSDIKFFVMHGNVVMIQVDVERFAGHKRHFFDREWRELDVLSSRPRGDEPPARPETVDEMLQVAEKLGRPFKFARVDLYDTADGIRFGEITHYPNAGMTKYSPADFDRALGESWKSGQPLPERFLLDRQKTTIQTNG